MRNRLYSRLLISFMILAGGCTTAPEDPPGSSKDPVNTPTTPKPRNAGISQKRVTYGELSEQLRDLGFTEDNGGRWYFSFKDDSGNTLHTVEVQLKRNSENGFAPAYSHDHVITSARIGIVGDSYGSITINKDGTLSPSLGLFFTSDGKTFDAIIPTPEKEERYKRESERLSPVFTSVLEKFNNAINVYNSALYGGSYDELTSIISQGKRIYILKPLSGEGSGISYEIGTISESLV